MGLHPHPRLLPSREKGSDRLRGERRDEHFGGEISNMGLIWLNLASFTPSDEGGNEATVASFGIPSTPTHCASMRPRWPRLASSGVVRRGETFNSVAFGCIRLHSFPRTLILTPLPDSQRDARFPPSRERRMRFDACEQCSNQRGYGVMGSCHQFGVGAPPHPAAARRDSRLRRMTGLPDAA